MTNPSFKPGDRVRFRLGERIPIITPCCGKTLDGFALLKQFHGQIFTVGNRAVQHCPFCGWYSPDDDSTIVILTNWEVNGESYSSFGAYPQELEHI